MWLNLEPGERAVHHHDTKPGSTVKVLGVASGDSKRAAIWSEFLYNLREAGLHGTQFMISDSHLRLKTTIANVFPWAS